MQNPKSPKPPVFRRTRIPTYTPSRQKRFYFVRIESGIYRTSRRVKNPDAVSFCNSGKCLGYGGQCFGFEPHRWHFIANLCMRNPIAFYAFCTLANRRIWPLWGSNLVDGPRFRAIGAIEISPVRTPVITRDDTAIA